MLLFHASSFLRRVDLLLELDADGEGRGHGETGKGQRPYAPEGHPPPSPIRFPGPLSTQPATARSRWPRPPSAAGAPHRQRPTPLGSALGGGAAGPVARLPDRSHLPAGTDREPPAGEAGEDAAAGQWAIRKHYGPKIHSPPVTYNDQGRMLISVLKRASTEALTGAPSSPPTRVSINSCFLAS